MNTSTFVTQRIGSQGAVACAWLKHPDSRNAFNDRVVAELTVTFTTLWADDSVRDFLQGGHGKAICARGNMNWMCTMADRSWAQPKADAPSVAAISPPLKNHGPPVRNRRTGDAQSFDRISMGRAYSLSGLTNFSTDSHHQH
ncbi:MAG: hypothetical protein C4K60_08205 [Ideonella sp. MAG2]|nr:MAG: hypothetical protein C4K60_08205 [Ideonella sp. MAG2]